MVKQSTPHGKTVAQLKKFKMFMLLDLVTKHHLAQHIHLYKTMKKAELVQALSAHEKKVPAGKADVQTRGKAAAPAPPDLGRGKRVKKPTAKMAALKKGKGKTSRPKIGMTYFGA